MATTKKTTSSNGGAPVGEVTPEEAAKIRSSAGGKEQAPSSEQQSIFANWRQAADQLGDPFEVELVPISKLRAMRRDPMLGFGLSFIKTPHIRAKWYINAADSKGPNAQIAAHLDHDIRKIYPSFVHQYMNSLDFGFQAIAKRYEFRKPVGNYIETNPDSGEQEEKQIWSEGNIDPIAFKPFVALPPEYVNPIWKQGAFDGIDFDPASGTAPAGLPAQTGNEKKFKIDLYHSLWVTNEKDQNFGSVFGYPRLGYAYRYWWSYWFRWAIADRAFERKADPSVIVYHPEGVFEDSSLGTQVDYADYALTMGERMRSGGVIALPSETYEDVNGRGTTRQWEIDFTKDATNFEPFDNSFDYLDVQKLRSLWIPEQAFLEGKGGTSSRNVAAEMGDSFTESQGVLSAQLIDTINRFVIPQWIAVNFPEFAEAGGSAEFVMQGFADDDIEFTKQVIQMIGQQESGANEIRKMVDLKKVLEQSGTPLASVAEQQRKQEEIDAAAVAANPPPVAAVPGGVGVIPSSTGFSYFTNPGDRIELAESPSEFLSNLPATDHYSDKTVRAFAKQIWNSFDDLYRDEYKSAVEAIMSEDDAAPAEDKEVEFADDDSARQAERIMSKWKGSGKWVGVLDRTYGTLTKLAKRAIKLEMRKGKTKQEPADEEVEDWIKVHLAEAAARISKTTRTEVRDFITQKFEEGIIDRTEIARLTREHFDTFPGWKADRVVRTEVRDVYNAGTLLAAQAAGVKVQAKDALSGDTDADCEDRDGRLFDPVDAFKEQEHPNGTLGWKILPVTELSIERQPFVAEGVIGRYDPDTETIFFSNDATQEQEKSYLKLIGEAIVLNA